MADLVPSWKFWHPLPLWQVILIALALEIACTIPFVALRELTGIAVPEWIGAGIGGAVMIVVIRALARRKLEAGR